MFGTTTTQTVQRSVIFHAVGLAFRLLWIVLKVLWRFAWGMPLDGNMHTDATFLSAGTQDIREKKWFALRQPSRWAYLPGYKRMLIRWLAVGAVVVWLLWPTLVMVAAVVVAGVALGLAIWQTIDFARHFHHNRYYVQPLHVALSGPLRRESDRPADWLDVPLDFRDEDTVVTVALPADYNRTPAEDKLIERVVTDKLGLADGETETRWHMRGDAPYVEFAHAPRPPELVTVDDVRELLEAAPESAPLLGLGRRSKPIAVDLDIESPHVLISMQTGAGKSMLARGLAVQFLRHGAQVVYLDLKRHSHPYARGLPGVTYVRNIEDIHNALRWLAAEGERRNRIADEDDTAEFTRIVVICEEMNATTRKLQRFWKTIKDKDDPAISPAVEALNDILFMGRAVKIHVVAIGQLMTARASGGTEARENFGVRILGRYTVNAWRMLVPEVWPMPRSSKRRGRVQVVLAGIAEETQTILWTDDEAREWATSGEDASQRPKLALTLPLEGMTPGTVPGTGAELAAGEATTGPEGDLAESLAAELVTLREACEQGIVTLSEHSDPDERLRRALEILRSARKRDPEFPESAGQRGQDKLYAPAALQVWERNRPKSITPDPELEPELEPDGVSDR
jgi:hypothetical protein